VATLKRKSLTAVSRKPAATAGGRAKPKAAAAALATTAQGAQTWVLDVPFAYRGVAAASGAKWDAESGVFMYIGSEVPLPLMAFMPLRYSYEAFVQRELDEEWSVVRLPTPHANEPGPVLTPRPHQRQAIDAIVDAHRAKRPGFLLADDVGLGKTISAWGAIARLPNAQRVLIVAPLSVLAHWRATVSSMGDLAKLVVILNYDKLGKLFDVTPAARKRIRSKKGLAKAGTAPEFDVIVWDESHRCKNPTAARAKLAAKLTQAADFCLWLSATAGQNPLELSYLAPLLANVTGGRTADLKDFELWCSQQGIALARGKYGKWEWQGDVADCRKVRALLFDARGNSAPAGLRRRPEDIAGWPALNRILAPIELGGEARQLYQQAWSAFRREMDLSPRGKDPKGALAATLRLRQKSSLIRVAGTAELVHELLDNEHQVAISVAFKETLEALRDALGMPCAAIHGGLGAQERELERLRFQRGDVPIVMFTVEEGISLHQGEHNEVPRSEVIHDLRWSAIQMAQIEGRCHRDGRFAQVYWAYADNTIEDRIARVVAGRIQSMKEMIGDDTATMREIEQLLFAES
jgi:SNF2-related domain